MKYQIQPWLKHFSFCLALTFSCQSSDEQAPVTGELAAPALFQGEFRETPDLGYGHVRRVKVAQQAQGQNGHWWCSQHFGRNLVGHWQCVDVSGTGTCGEDVRSDEFVSCSRQDDVQSVNTRNLSHPGRTGDWWCTSHFGGNLGGAWDCLDVEDGSCEQSVAANKNVTCGRSNQVD
jgi:hypothetical protein